MSRSTAPLMVGKGGEGTGDRPVTRRPNHQNAVTDLLGRPAILQLTPGNVADVAVAGALLDAAGPVCCRIADKGYDANALRKRLTNEGAAVVIPGRSNRKLPISYDEEQYRHRWRIEAAFCGLNDFRGVATRYDKRARNFLSTVALATLIAFWV